MDMPLLTVFRGCLQDEWENDDGLGQHKELHEY